MQPHILFLGILAALTFFFTHVNTLERTIFVQGESYKLKQLKNFDNVGVERVNIVGGRIFYKLNNAWWLLSNVGGPDYTVSPYTELSCYVDDAHIPSVNESIVDVKSKGLTVHLTKRCDDVWYCELNTLIIITCSTNGTNDPLTHFHFFDVSKIMPWDSTKRHYAERIPLLATDFPGYGKQSYARIYVDPLTDQMVFRMNNDISKGASIWSIRNMKGKWNDSL